MPSLPRSQALALIAGSLVAVTSSPARAQTDAGALRIGSMSIDAMGEAYYGADRGFFHDNGVTPAFILSGGVPPSSSPTVADLTPGYGAVKVGQKPTTAVSYCTWPPAIRPVR